jgi:hypothetical protein
MYSGDPPILEINNKKENDKQSTIKEFTRCRNQKLHRG